MRRLIPLSFLVLIAMACGATVETTVQASTPPSIYTLFSPKNYPNPPKSAPLPPSDVPTIFSPKPTYRKQLKVIISIDEKLDPAFAIQVNNNIQYAIELWNSSFGYEVFSKTSGNANLNIKYMNEYGSRDGKNIGGVFNKGNCINQSITLYKSSGMLRQVVLHELGHALGLSHSENIGDIMYRSTEFPRIILSDNDISRAKESIKLQCK